jgi:hypothetical protein
VRVLRTPPVLGLLIGIAAALIFVAVVTAIAGSDTQVWWWPAVAVFGGIGGGVLGSLMGAEAEGESPDESYDGDPARDA